MYDELPVIGAPGRLCAYAAADYPGHSGKQLLGLGPACTGGEMLFPYEDDDIRPMCAAPDPALVQEHWELDSGRLEDDPNRATDRG